MEKHKLDHGFKHQHAESYLEFKLRDLTRRHNEGEDVSVLRGKIQSLMESKEQMIERLNVYDDLIKVSELMRPKLEQIHRVTTQFLERQEAEGGAFLSDDSNIKRFAIAAKIIDDQWSSIQNDRQYMRSTWETLCNRDVKSFVVEFEGHPEGMYTTYAMKWDLISRCVEGPDGIPVEELSGIKVSAPWIPDRDLILWLEKVVNGHPRFMMMEHRQEMETAAAADSTETSTTTAIETE
jgi:hypothetical protein